MTSITASIYIQNFIQYSSSRLNRDLNEIIGDYQRGSQHNGSITDQIFFTHQILEKKLEYSGIIHQIFTDFEKAYDSIRRVVLHNILIEFGINMKLDRPIKTCLN
jgi:hypothetical protein